MATGIFKLRDQLLGLVQKAWTGSQTTPAVEYLVVAGGGAGNYTGGGGAGGLLQGILPVTNGSSLTVTVGAGGVGQSGGTPGTAGLNSVFSNITAIGGGLGVGNYLSPAAINNGGSGGGGPGVNVSSTTNVPNPAGNGVSGQGNAGGAGYFNGAVVMGGGGGGAGTVGLPAVNGTIAGNGGAGIASSISGSVVAYAGGGGGGTANATSTASSGGVGGGGAGGSGSGGGTSGTVNTGGGGGSGSYNGSFSVSGNGGSGICIISYPDTYNAPTSLTGTYTASTSGSGSVLFTSSSSQYISYPASTAWVLNSDFTIEIWYYPVSFGSNTTLLDQYTSNSTGGGSWEFYLASTTGIPSFYYDALSVITSSTALTLNSWNHICATRTGTSISFYLNGTRVGTATSSATVGQNLTMWIGAQHLSGPVYYANGYISNARIVKGTNVYGSGTTITVPTAPLTAVSGTSLLLNTVSGSQFTDSSTNSFTPTAVNSPTWNQSSPFATGLGYKNRVYTWTGSGTVTF
jgi:hypothetical protein